MITSATRDLMNQRQKKSNREINALMSILRNQLPRQYWLIAQSLRLSAEGDLTDILAIVKFQQGLTYDVGASGQLRSSAMTENQN